MSTNAHQRRRVAAIASIDPLRARHKVDGGEYLWQGDIATLGLRKKQV